MPVLKRPEAEIYYEVHGKGFPLLIFAPGGLRSQLAFWRHSPADPSKPAPWLNPEKDLGDLFTVVAMDQRNAGRSTATVKPTDGWQTFAEDHLALMDHLGHARFHTMGGCIGASYCLKLAEMAPERVTACVLQNPIGLHDNQKTWDDGIETFIKHVRGRDPSIAEATIRAFGKNMFGSTDFVFSVSRDFVKRCKTPLLLQHGNDGPHPRATSDEIEALAPKGIELQRDWKGPEFLAESIKRVRAFLQANTPRDAKAA
jgi:pimeloyl-ACP methyl ester carboxylesterase